LGIVAALAGQTGVAALERVARLAVVKLLQADVPANGDEILSVVLGVALEADVLALVGSQQ
jgi:hypothetical protein